MFKKKTKPRSCFSVIEDWKTYYRSDAPGRVAMSASGRFSCFEQEAVSPCLILPVKAIPDGVQILTGFHPCTRPGSLFLSSLRRFYSALDGHPSPSPRPFVQCPSISQASLQVLLTSSEAHGLDER